MHPLEYKNNRTSKDAIYRILFAWVLGVLLWLPCVIIIRYHYDKENIDPKDCFFTYDKYFVLVQSFVAYYTPIIVMSFFYVACLYKLHERYGQVSK